MMFPDESKCIACSLRRENWRDGFCPLCGCPQRIYPIKPKYIPYRLYEWYWKKLEWPKLKQSYKDKLVWKQASDYYWEHLYKK